MFDTILGMATDPVPRAPTDDFWYTGIGTSTRSGVNVSEETAMAFVTVYSIVAKQAKTMATLPLDVVEKRGAERIPTDHWLEDLLTGQANPEATGMTVRETLWANLELWGNAYAEIVWSSDRLEAMEIIPLQTRYVTVGRGGDDKLSYKYAEPGKDTRYLPASHVWHIPGLSFNGITGLSPIGYNREAVGLGIATATFGSSFFKNGTWAGGWVERDPDATPGVGELSRENGLKLVASIEDKLKGAEKAFSVFLLREGMKYHQTTTMPLKDAQFIELRRYNRVDLCGIWDMPPSLIHDLTDGTFNNTEEQGRMWVRDSLRPRAVRFEASAKARFFPNEPLHLRHNMNGLLRGAFKDQMEAFATGRQWGIFNVNECRELLELNPVPGGEERLTPLNMVALGAERLDVVTLPKENEQALLAVDSAEETLALFPPIAADCGTRIANREIRAVESSYRKRVVKEEDVEGFKAWVDKFYTEQVTHFRDAVAPMVKMFQTAANHSAVVDAAGMAEAYANAEYDTVLAMLEQPGGVPTLIEKWKEQKAQSIAEGLLGVFRKSLGGSDDG
jgi:HK97 family phage portal protein